MLVITAEWYAALFFLCWHCQVAIAVVVKLVDALHYMCYYS